MINKHLLILGGTTEAYALARHSRPAMIYGSSRRWRGAPRNRAFPLVNGVAAGLAASPD
ncbi:hypothetical protein [Chromatium okenii]|uniref:hypothetical protein n=1 Tax=Chromatium okenii TaxID=61644 RepID=UPI001F5B4EF9|nr:hypothetical protein [Chromatium okenii]